MRLTDQSISGGLEPIGSEGKRRSHGPEHRHRRQGTGFEPGFGFEPMDAACARASHGRARCGQPESARRRSRNRRRGRGPRRGLSRPPRRAPRRGCRDRGRPGPWRRPGRRDDVRHARALRAPGAPAALRRGHPRGGNRAGRDRIRRPDPEGERPRPGASFATVGSRSSGRRAGTRPPPGGSTRHSASTRAPVARWSFSSPRSPSTAAPRPPRGSRGGSPEQRPGSWSIAGAPTSMRSRSASIQRSTTTPC